MTPERKVHKSAKLCICDECKAEKLSREFTYSAGIRDTICTACKRFIKERNRLLSRKEKIEANRAMYVTIPDAPKKPKAIRTRVIKSLWPYRNGVNINEHPSYL